MGNELIAEEIADRIYAKKSMKRFIASKLQKRKRGETIDKNNGKKDDSFFVKYLNKNKGNMEIMNDISSFDQKRQVFISLIGLFQTWTKMPSHVLYSAIFCLPLKREWIYDIVKHRAEYLAHDVIKHSLFLQSTEDTKEFIELLKWKDSQGLVFWMMDDFRDLQSVMTTHSQSVEQQKVNNNNNNNNDIAPFWQHLSAKLKNLYDPVTRDTYNPIKLDYKWWNNTFKQLNLSKYENDLNEIIPELQYLSSMKFKVIQEIIYQSNPSSLNPIISYHDILENVEKNNQYKENKNEPCFMDEGNETESDKDDIDLGEGWWISEDYDPYDIDDQELY